MSSGPESPRADIVDRIRARLRADGFDAYLAYTPQNNFYCSGFMSWFVGEHWRFHGGILTLVPADPALPLAVMVAEVEMSLARQATSIEDVRGYQMWIETRELDVITRPPADGAPPLRRTDWWDRNEQDQILRDLLGDRGLLEAQIGTDLGYMILRFAERLRSVAPQVRWADWTDAMFDLRAIKEPFEVDRLRRAIELQEMAFGTVRDSLHEGMTAAEAERVYTREITNAVDADGRYADYASSWLLPNVGLDGDRDTHTCLRAGDLVKLDGGVTLGGYKSDGGRTFAFGSPAEAARRLYDTLLVANDLACAALVPGEPISGAFLAAERHMHQNGYPQYCRGQYGHSIGLEQFPEEPPFISRDEHRPVEAGMVLAVETPYYGKDIGAMIIEDLILVTEDGSEPLHRLPRELVVVG